MLLAFSAVQAADAVVRVFDREGRPIAGVVVTLNGSAPSRAMTSAAVMDQVDQRFVPFILPVRVGTAVTFPNSDTIAHQVYSFSQAKRFELGLYRGRPYPPVTFDKHGIVVLGCNIHDRMIGYVYVTDATAFGKTDARGEWHASVPSGHYEVELWSPLLGRGEPDLKRSVQLVDTPSNVLEFRLTRAMRSEPSAPRDPKIRDY